MSDTSCPTCHQTNERHETQRVCYDCRIKILERHAVQHQQSIRDLQDEISHLKAVTGDS